MIENHELTTKHIHNKVSDNVYFDTNKKETFVFHEFGKLTIDQKEFLVLNLGMLEKTEIIELSQILQILQILQMIPDIVFFAEIPKLLER